MTPRQEKFATEYLVDMNATQAAIRAGYSKKTAASQGERLLRNVEIEKRVGELRQEQEERTLLEADDVVMGLHTEATREGEGSSHSARVSAWGHLGKHLGIFGPKGSEDDPKHYSFDVHLTHPDDEADG